MLEVGCAVLKELDVFLGDVVYVPFLVCTFYGRASSEDWLVFIVCVSLTHHHCSISNVC